MTSKAELIQRIRSDLTARRERLEMAAREAHAAATDPDAKAESKYDTRGLEASYLAAGQAKQAETLAEAIQALESASFPDFGPDAPIAATTARHGFFSLQPPAGSNSNSRTPRSPCSPPKAASTPPCSDAAPANPSTPRQPPSPKCGESREM